MLDDLFLENVKDVGVVIPFQFPNHILSADPYESFLLII